VQHFADMSEDKTKKPQKSGQRSGVANPGQPLTGNKNQGDDLEAIIPRDIGNADRPTRDDGDNDDEGALGSGQK
jgi:hypothetical protein